MLVKASVALASIPSNSIEAVTESKRKTVVAVIHFTATTRLGMVVNPEETGERLVISGFTDMPEGVSNPSVVAGVKIGDLILEIDGKMPAGVDESMQLLRSAKDSVRLTLLRQE